MYQPIYSIIAKNADENKRQEFTDTINEVLSDIVKNGIDMRMIDAGINYYDSNTVRLIMAHIQRD